MLSREKTKTDDQRQDVNDYPVKEQYVLSRLLPEYVSLYRIDLNSGKYEILRLDANTNARQLAEKDPHPPENFDEYVRRYADNFILDEEKEEFIDWHLCANMKRRLLHEEKLTYHYHSVSKEGKDSYYEAYVVKGKTDDETFDAFLGYRNIDSILYKEKEIQEKLQKALNEARLGNEIISSIARTYQYISRIDIQADYFEEISNRDVEHLKYIHSGTLSENNKRVCRGLVAEEYQDAFEKFTDISTLPERMKDEESVVMEYRMKDGSWHSLRFIEKKRDETGRLTHVLCAIRSISDAKRREQTLIYQVAEAKKDAAVKTRFLSNMSHDIRTPMNGIIGMVELANRYPNDPEIQQKCRDKIILLIMPILWAMLLSLKTNNEIVNSPLSLPQTISFENYQRAIDTIDFARMYFNTILLVVVSTFFSILFTFMSSFAIARMVFRNHKTSETLYLFLLIGIGIPIYVLLFPVYRIDSLMGILGTRLGLILPYVAVNISFNTLLFTGFLRDIPGELEEAAIIDGCNLFKLCTKVVIPVMKPTFVTIIIFNAVYIYNEFPFASTFIQNNALNTVSLMTSMFKGQYTMDYSGIIAASLMIMLPELVFYVILQKYIISGMTAGAVKG